MEGLAKGRRSSCVPGVGIYFGEEGEEKAVRRPAGLLRVAA